MVSLIGGGPGEAELITVKGLKRLREADCIVYDRLSSPELLLEAKKGCELIYVGKESHNHTMKQEEMNLLLVEKAKQYEKVVRLKGGDPYVFGRGGEEALVLKEHGIPFEIVPGISSALAGLCYAGIPITHRGVAMGFHVVTAHNKRDELADIDFEAMARGTDTCVFLMGLSKVKEIAQKLMEAGMSPSTPAAVISKATTKEQRTCVAPLADIADEVALAQLPSPALIVVGEVVKLREKLNFFEQKELFGKHYLVTKIGDEPSRLGALLQEKGAAVTEVTTGIIQRKKAAFSKEMLEQADWLVFTSVHGVQAFFENLRESGLDVRSLWHCKIASIGRKTSAALERFGIRPDLEPEKADAKSLAEALQREVSGSEVLLYLKAQETAGTLREALAGKCEYREIVVYENHNALSETSRSEILAETYDGIFFTCASSARRLLSGHGTKSVCFSIGEQTTKALTECGVTDIREAERADYEALVELALYHTKNI